MREFVSPSLLVGLVTLVCLSGCSSEGTWQQDRCIPEGWQEMENFPDDRILVWHVLIEEDGIRLNNERIESRRAFQLISSSQAYGPPHPHVVLTPADDVACSRLSTIASAIANEFDCNGGLHCELSDDFSLSNGNYVRMPMR